MCGSIRVAASYLTIYYMIASYLAGFLKLINKYILFVVKFHFVTQTLWDKSKEILLCTLRTRNHKNETTETVTSFWN